MSLARKEVFQNECQKVIERTSNSHALTSCVILPPSAQHLPEVQMKYIEESILDMELPVIPKGMTTILEAVCKTICFEKL